MKKRKLLALLMSFALATSFLAGCGNNKVKTDKTENEKIDPDNLVSAGVDDKYGACYQVFIYSFCDSDGDGIGDFNGLTSKLDYIKDLGFDSIWVLPFNKSNTYHKYDVADYYEVDPEYGTMEDFEKLMAACDEKNIDVYMDFVINHSSSNNEWFVQARNYLKSLPEDAEIDYTECPYAEYYNFLKIEDGDKIPGGYRLVSGTKKWYYECQFSSNMPDLNLDCEALKKEIQDIAKFWVDKGIDGFRLDAALHYYEGNIPKSVEALKWFCDYVKSLDPELYTVAEVWSDFSTINNFYASGIDSVFDFPVGDKDGAIVSATNRNGNGKCGTSLGNSLVKVYNKLKEKNENAIDAVFIGNHDTGRAAGFLHRDINTIKLGAALEILAPGKAFVYYGDELGMVGTGRDENKRAPMYWTSDESAEGMTKGPAQMETNEHIFPSYEEQKDDPSSIYNFYKQALLVRNAFPSISRGVPSVMEKVCEQDGNLYALQRTTDGETTYVIFNINELDSSTVTVPKDTYNYSGIAAGLYVGEEKATLDGEKLTIPAFGCVVLK